MKIDFYTSLSEKNLLFHSHLVDSKIEFDKMISVFESRSKEPHIYRGVSESKFKLYNSAQRIWKIQELYKLNPSYDYFIKEEIKNAKAFQNNLLDKFYSAFGLKTYDLSVLSFLQHYGAPTPLLDFTHNYKCSLFFAIDGMKQSPSTDIDNYISIYSINISSSKEFFPSIIDRIESDYNNPELVFGKIEPIDFIDISKQSWESLISASRKISIENLSYDYLDKLSIFYMPSRTSHHFQSYDTRERMSLIYNQHNLNIINQEGLFVYNSSSDKSLENIFNQNSRVQGRIECWNIHKSLNEYINTFLEKNNITKEFIYPQEEYIAEKAFRDYKKNL